MKSTQNNSKSKTKTKTKTNPTKQKLISILKNIDILRNTKVCQYFSKLLPEQGSSYKQPINIDPPSNYKPSYEIAHLHL